MVYSKTSVVDLSTNLGEMVINTFSAQNESKIPNNKNKKDNT